MIEFSTVDYCLVVYTFLRLFSSGYIISFVIFVLNREIVVVSPCISEGLFLLCFEIIKDDNAIIIAKITNAIIVIVVFFLFVTVLELLCFVSFISFSWSKLSIIIGNFC